MQVMFLTPHITVKKTRGRGRGVFATAEIEPGTVIGDYLGVVTKSDKGPKYLKGRVYDMWYSDTVDLYPNPREKGVHLLNTSCEPNCAMAVLGRRTIIVALRRIFRKEELTYDYFLGEQDEDCEPGTDNCSCGSPFCRGTMFSNPAAYAAWDQYLERTLKNIPHRPPVPYGKKLPPLTRYPKHITALPIHPLFGTHVRKPIPCPATILKNPRKLRQTMRESGRKIFIKKLNILVEGILYGGHIVMRHTRTRR